MKPVHFFQTATGFFNRHARHCVLLLGGMLVMASSHALPKGIVTTLYNGPLPQDAAFFCDEGRTCAVTGVKELWYGARETWGYKLVSGNVLCSYQEFTDVLYGTVKKCYVRDAVSPTLLPPLLANLPASFNLNDLLTVDAGRYKVDAVVNGKRESITQARTDKVLTALSTGNTNIALTQSFFQFNITDTASPVQDYAVTVSTTQDRCLVHHRTSATSTEVSIGRIVEVYTMTARPEAKIIPFRSDVEKICTNDKGLLAFHIAPPTGNAIQLRIVSHGYASQPNDVYDMFIPTHLNWLNL